MRTREVPVERLRELFYYTPSTGVLVWRQKNRQHYALQPAGGIDGWGYLKTEVDGKRILNHRIAWALHYGEWPDGGLDHVNRIKTDNRIANLRIASNSENTRNAGKHKDCMSGIRGVSLHKKTSRWRARINIDGKELSLGYFDNKDDAHLVRLVAEHCIWGGIHRLGEDDQE